MNRSWSKDSFKCIPRIIFKMLMSKSKSSVLSIKFKNNYIKVVTNFNKF